ncbi:MAG: diguanylate cyclase [Pseudomonadota bacterium]
MGWGKIWRERLWPAVPAEIRDELALLRYSRLVAQIPILYVTLLFVVLTALQAASADAPILIRFVLPVIITTSAFGRLLWWIRQENVVVSPQQARRQIKRMMAVSTVISSLCSLWCVISWSMSVPGERAYFPMMLAMGSLSTAFCLSVIRGATLSNLGVTLVPISIMQLATGTQMDMIAGAVTLIAAAFLLRLILQQHQQLIDLLVLKNQLREQANTDPLTGLLNRRALLGAMHGADPAEPMALALLDLDGFKPVNDTHGHGAGDELLVQIAQRMRAACGRAAVVARVGGDEFAIFLPGGTAPMMRGRVDQILASLAKPFSIAKARLTIGASAGIAGSPSDAVDAEALIAAADRALYAAKALQRGSAQAAAARPAITLSERRG